MVHHTHRKHLSVLEDYSAGSFTDLKDTVKDAVKKLKAYNDQFDCIVCTGISGLVVAAPVALALDKHLVVIRKKGEHAHSSSHIGISQLRERPDAIFLDDFVCSGDTIDAVEDALSAFPGLHVNWVADYLYRDNEWRARA